MAKRKTTMPEIGRVKRACEIGRPGTNQYIWQACNSCSKERWVKLLHGKPKSSRCHPCSMKGSKHPSWKGGRQKNSAGYILLWLSPEDFFYPMADKHHHVREHRLIMAKQLNRCLLPWEVVHHKNGIKDDNRLENLQLFPTTKQHSPDALLKSHLKQLENIVERQSQQIKLLQWHIRELNTGKKEGINVEEKANR